MKGLSAKKLRQIKKKVREFEEKPIPEVNDPNWFNWHYNKQEIDKLKRQLENA